MSTAETTWGTGANAEAIQAWDGPPYDRGEAVGVDAAPKFIKTARREAGAAGVANARLEVADVQVTPPEGPFDLAFSRFGTMFFASPVAALRNVPNALAPGMALGPAGEILRLAGGRGKHLHGRVHEALREGSES